MNLRRLCTTLLLALVPLGFLAVMVVAPLFALAAYDSGGMVREILQDGYMRHRIGWTVFQAAVTCVLTVLAGVPTGWVLARLDFFGRGWILRLLMLPFVMPTLVAGMGVLALFGAHGALWAGWQDTPYLLLYGNVFFNLPVLVRSAYQGFMQVPEARLQTARTLGAGAWRRFTDVEWPVLRPWLAGGACLVFLYCFSGFGLALLLGGNRYATVEVEVYQLIAYELDMAQASVLVWLVLAVTAAAVGLNLTALPESFVSHPPSIAPIFAQFDFSMLNRLDFWVIMFTFFFVDFFDTVGTLVGVCNRSGLLDENGTLPNARGALLADAIGTTAGAILGTSTVTSYVESASGIAQGGRTGLSALVTAVLFLAAMFFTPIVGIVPSYATAPALVIVGVYMMMSLRDLNFDDWTELAPSILGFIMMPLAYNISVGIEFAIVSYVLIKILSGRMKDVSWLMAVLAVIFIVKEALS